MALRTLTLELEQEEFNRLLQTAKRRGYDDLADYLRDLAANDARSAGDEAEYPVEDPNDEQIIAMMKQGLSEAVRGEFISKEALWASLKDE